MILKLRLLGLFDADEDSLRFYYLGSNWRGDVEHHGAKPVTDPDDALFA
jgi:CRISPR-associated protein Cas2